MLTTRQKIALARIARAPVIATRRLLGQGPEVLVTRRGLNWKLDLREGIDFSIFLMGGFELRTIAAYASILRPGSVALDIGANIGAHALPLAEMVGPTGRVLAFEPTAFAFAKLQHNLSLNSRLQSRVRAFQMMLVARDAEELPEALYSSWPLDVSGDVHPKLRGRLMSTQGARAASLDFVLEQEAVERVDFIKLDVDGYECEVLRGALRTLKRHRPALIMEIAPYVLVEHGESLEELLGLLRSANYRTYDLNSGRPLWPDPSATDGRITDGAGFNVVARPD
jgi:FkbM family methyltransferase